MTNRISRLKTALFANTREISLERALLYTASHRQTEGEPVILRRAKATAYILEHVEISIRDEELIAGNRTVKPRAGIMSPEMDPYWLLKELDQFPTRPQDRFAISEEDKRIYREELFPYWEKRSMKDFINGQMTDEVKAATSTQIFSINQTDKGQGHIIIDYPRLLNHGLGELVAQMQQHCQQQPENHFYQAALLLLEASQKHILRYAELAETMAANCTDAQRREELLTIAEISRHNAQHKPQTFWQACQLFWYMNIILQYESNASSLSLGRFDQYMLPFYQASLTQGEDPAFLKELLESLWVKCNDIVLLRSTSSARYFAGFPTGYTALLGGLTENGRSAVNVLSFLCLDAYQSVQLPQPNLGVRTNALIDTPFLMKTAETIRLGTGIPQIFNDEVVVPAFLNESNASSLSLGRFDQYMLPFYQASLTQGEDPAFLKELLESLWVKCNDIVLLRSTSSARYFAGFPTGYTALLGGLTENGRSAVNVLSFLCLDAYQSVQLPQPNLGVRTNALIDTPFLMKTAETIRLGTGIPQIFNDEVVVPAFLNRGVSLEDARDYSVVGCVELSIPGRTYGLHDIAMFNLLKVMEICLHENEGNAALTYEGLLEQIRAKISHYITLMVEGSNICDIGHRDWAPVPLLSSFISDCLEKGRDITDGGARYNFSGVQGIGIANLSDSLHALKGMVFEQQRLSFDELLSVLKANFATPEGEKVRARLINRFEKYGNDIDEVDNISAELLRHYCKEVEKYQNPRGGYFTPGSYTVSAHVPLGSVVGATPDGRFAGEQLADGGLSPMLGQDAQGPTAVLKSVSKLDNTLLSNGTLLNVKFTPATLEGEAGLRKLADFLRAFTQLKLQHIQFNVVNADTLREAQQRPQDYAGLVVRVAGYSAFFVELSKEIQDDIIRRTAHQL